MNKPEQEFLDHLRLVRHYSEKTALSYQEDIDIFNDFIFKEGKNGSFVGCSNFPTCKYVQKEEKPANNATPIGEQCPDCGGELLIREKNGSTFVTCSNFPKCRYTRKMLTTNTSATIEDAKPVKDCPDCDGYLIKKKGKYGYFLGCINYPKCSHMERIPRKKRK